MLSAKKLMIVVIMALIFVGLFVRYGDRAPKRHYSDFRVYYATGQRFLAKSDVYARPDESITPYKYSPTFAMIVSPLALVSQNTASLIFFTLNFMALVFALIFSKKLITGDEPSFKKSMILYSLTALATVRFTLHAMDAGQVGIMIFALVVFGLHFLGRDKISAFFMSLSIMFKYTSAVFLPYFLVRKKIRLVAFVVLFSILFLLLPALYVGADKAADYVKGWLPFISKTSFDMGSLYDGKNQSLFSMFLRSTKWLPGGGFKAGIILTLFSGAVLYLLIMLPRGTDILKRNAEYSLLFICMVLFNPNGWLHNFAVISFAYMTLFYYLIQNSFKDKFVLISVALSFVLLTFTGDTFVGDYLENMFESFSFITIGVVILIFPLLKIKFRR